MTKRENDAGTPGTAETDAQTTVGQLTMDQWLADIKEVRSKIDPETAEVTGCYGDSLDPYGVDALPEEYQSADRIWYSLPPNSVGAAFFELPDGTFKLLKGRMTSGELQTTLANFRYIQALRRREQDR
jgi:hypothetical protein